MIESPREAEERWYAWRADRKAGLSQEHGWLSLVDFEWIGTEPQRSRGFPGTWWVDGDTLHAEIDDDASVTSLNTGEPQAGWFEWTFFEDDSDLDLVHGSRLAEIARRDGKYVVRLRDANAPLIQIFDGVPVFDYNTRFVRAGSVTLIEPQEVPRETVRDDVSATAKLLATLELSPRPGERAGGAFGKPITLYLEGNVAGDFVLSFFDATNGDDTADWRFLTFRSPFGADAQVGDSADVVVDFNFSMNFPAAFTDFGTCPKALPENVIPWRVEAGEKKPLRTDGN